MLAISKLKQMLKFAQKYIINIFADNILEINIFIRSLGDYDI